MTDIGPIQVLAVTFGPEARYEGQILDEVERLEGSGRIRVLDLMFIAEEAGTGEAAAFDYQGDELGGLVSALLGFPFVEVGTEPVVVKAPPEGGSAVGLSRRRLRELLDAVPPDVAVGLLLIEHVWARDLKRAIREAGGVPMFEGFLEPEALAVIGAEVEHAVRLLDELDR